MIPSSLSDDEKTSNIQAYFNEAKELVITTAQASENVFGTAIDTPDYGYFKTVKAKEEEIEEILSIMRGGDAFIEYPREYTIEDIKTWESATASPLNIHIEGNDYFIFMLLPFDLDENDIHMSVNGNGFKSTKNFKNYGEIKVKTANEDLTYYLYRSYLYWDTDSYQIEY